ncbi:MAG: 4Fe-4S binding protein, partial [Syntrophobacteraceae bacterium]|nr:4Fe-4S binding protein [Syntrophobacteraceae bacterium]
MPGKRVIIFGGDPAGLAMALKQAEAGVQVTLIEPSPGLGEGRIPQNRIISDGTQAENPDIEASRRHPSIRIITNAKIERATTENGSYHLRVTRRTPRVHPEKCNDCKACIRVCPIHMYDDFNEGIGFRTAIDFFNPKTGVYNIFKEDMPICQATCPANLDIRSYVGLIADGNYAASLAKIRERLPFALAIGRVCPHPCETACNRGYVDEPISICTLKRFVADWEMHHDVDPPVDVPKKFHDEKVAIIGAGPSLPLIGIGPDGEKRIGPLHLHFARLDADGRDEVLGATIFGPDGRLRSRAAEFKGHIDSVFVADVRPETPGLEVV